MEKVSFSFSFFNPRVANKIIRYRQEDVGFVHCESVSYSVMVITQDSESCDPGSSPGRTLILHFFTTQTGGVGLTCLKHCFNMPGCPRGPRGQT